MRRDTRTVNKNHRITLSLILIVFLASCMSTQNFLQESTDTDKLPLSSVLIKPEDIQGQWKWTNTYDEESLITPLPDYKTQTPGSDDPITDVFAAFGGYSEGYYFSFTHIVKEYSSQEFVPGLQPDESFAQPFLLNLNGIGGNLNYECSQDPLDAPVQVFLCRISVQYGDVETFLFISGDPRIGQENIETMIRHILLTVEERIKRYQAQ